MQVFQVSNFLGDLRLGLSVPKDLLSFQYFMELSTQSLSVWGKVNTVKS